MSGATSRSWRAWRSPGDALSWRWRPRALVVALVIAALLVPLGAVVLTTGTLRIELGDVLPALFGQGETADVRVLQLIRAPRLVAGLAVGAALGISGALFQSLSRNPLGSPDIVGFLTGAASGAIVAILVLGAPPLGIAAAAVIGGVVTSALVYVLAFRRGATGGYRLVLVGIGAGALLGALNDLLMTRSAAENAIVAQLWLTGTLNARTWAHALPVLIAVLVLLVPAVALARGLSALELGDDVATQSGMRVEAVRIGTLAVGIGLAALAVAAAGPVSFVALAAPQIVKRLSGGGGPSIVGSALLGSALLVGADVLSTTLPLPVAVPVGLMTGLLGGIYLIWLLGRGRR
ncbi:iron chelate uptake ABC transporter family permease subunit [Schumannella sp. 10F1B-5-1]|uniref:FecCD family ABC transporter permease n=1 Tax=Schumannella sp. 10F1B-5-1 TaxID=2590780 RepID=UPI0011314911|nr:iron chelate uptake ABC transporter family permease subunit [Schumannella sp. 10F1B-5-1]TPW72338.1 iron chelate uptake ABC transporter family permease subunit [Schumannella sp. 10F1B-5-1]